MDRLADLGGCFESIAQRRVTEKRSVVYGLGYPGDVLGNDAARAYVHVPDFGISHLRVRQAHLQSGRVNQGVGIFSPEAIPVGFFGAVYGVKDGIFRIAPAVQNDENIRSVRELHGQSAIRFSAYSSGTI